MPTQAEELKTFVIAAQSGNQSDLDALESFLVTETGQTMDELTGGVWSEVRFATEPTTVELTVFGVTFTITIDRVPTGTLATCVPPYAYAGLNGDTVEITTRAPDGAGSTWPDIDVGWTKIYSGIFGQQYTQHETITKRQHAHAKITFGVPQVVTVPGTSPIRASLDNPRMVHFLSSGNVNLLKIPLTVELTPLIMELSSPPEHTLWGTDENEAPIRHLCILPQPNIWFGISKTWRAEGDLSGRPDPGDELPLVNGLRWANGDWQTNTNPSNEILVTIYELHGAWQQIGYSADSPEGALQSLIDQIEEFNNDAVANYGIHYYPQVTFDATTGKFTADYTTDNAAVYTPDPGCNSDGFDKAVIWLAQHWTSTLGESLTMNHPLDEDGDVHFGGFGTYDGAEAMSDYLGINYYGALWGIDNNASWAMKGSSNWQERFIGMTTYGDTQIVDTSLLDGEPPDTVPNTPRPPADGRMIPIPSPVSGGCRSTMDGPASCNWNVPLPEPNFEEPELNPDFPLPGDYPVFPDEFPETPEMPIFDANYPQFPNFCAPPDFGQMTDCQPQPGTNFMPGGRDRFGSQGTDLASYKTGSELYGAYDDTFNQEYPIDPITGEYPEDPDTGEPVVPPQRCWPANSSIMTAITTILLDLGVSPLNIVWEIGPEWDKMFGPYCFPTTTGMFDAAVWLAQKLMCRIIDEGAPSGKVYIGPPTHRPASQTFTFQDTYYPGISVNPPFANLAHGYSQSEAYFAVKVWGAHLSQPAWAIVDTPFAKDPSNYLSVEVGPNYTFAEAQELAFFRAALIRRAAVSVQVTVPYSENYYMRDTMILQVPSAGYQETFTIFGKQSEVSVESKAHILTGVLPATLAELDQFPDLIEEPVELGASFLDWPRMRSATKRKGEGRLKRHMRRRERMGLALS